MKVLGPVPKTTLSFNDFLAMSKVADQDGLISVEEVFKKLLMLPAVPRNIVKKITAAKANKEMRRKFLAPAPFACSSNWLLNKAIMNISKEKTPKITQLLKKLADTIAKKDIKRIRKRKKRKPLPNLAVSRKARETSPMNPKNMEKSFQPPIRLEVA